MIKVSLVYFSQKNRESPQGLPVELALSAAASSAVIAAAAAAAAVVIAAAAAVTTAGK